MNDPETHHHIYMLTGPVQVGKTSLVTDIVDRLKEDEINVSGFLCPGTFSNGRRSEFHLIQIETGFQIHMGTEHETKDWIKYRRFYFNPEAFIRGSEWIMAGLSKPVDLVVIDEVGPMELEGLGWSKTINFLHKIRDIKQLWVVRQQISQEVSRQWKIPEENIFTFESVDNDKNGNRLLQKLRSNI